MDERTIRSPHAEVSTLPELLVAMLAECPSSTALNYREAGYWRSMSSEQFCEQVRRSSLGLVRLGLKPGEAVGIIGPSSPWWLVADFAILAAGGVSVPMFPNLADEHLEFESRHTGMRFLIALGEEGWTAAQRHRHRYEKVVVRGVADAKGREVIDYHDLLALGDRQSEQDPGLHARLRHQLDADAPATIIHTSGSTGMPKGVVLSHRNLLSQVAGAARLFALDPASDRACTCLPLAHVFERMVVLLYLRSGVPLYFCDDIRRLGEQLREIGPTVITMVPRLIEKLHARIEGQVAESHGLGRRIGRWALDLANRTPAHHGWSVGVADALVYRKLRAALGGNLRCLVVGGAALSQNLERFLHNVGIPVYPGYGLTEASPVLAVNAPGHTRIGTVGKAFPGVELRIAESGEILGRGPGIMKGYHRDPAATAAAIDEQGWLHTGDIGEIDGDGYLTITGRLKELFKTSNGKYVSPVPIEQALVAHELVDMAMVVAEGRRYVAALIFPDLEAVRRRKAAAGLGALSDQQWLDRPEVVAELDRHVLEVNARLDHWEQLRRWRCIAQAPSIEREELTPTMKLRRHVVCAHWAREVESLFTPAVRAEDAGVPENPQSQSLAVKEQP